MIGSDLFYIQLIIYRALASTKCPIVFYKNMILKFHKVYLCSIILNLSSCYILDSYLYLIRMILPHTALNSIKYLTFKTLVF